MDDNDKHIMTLCGMSAVFAALFGTPVTAALFSVEVISIGILYYSALVPCILSATISYAITEKFHITPTYFILNQVPEMSLATGIRVIILSVAAAVLSILFCMSMQVIGKTFKKYLKKDYMYIQREGKFCEVVPKGYTKATGIRYLLDYFDLPLENAYAFGDGSNDEPMLAYVPNSIIMKKGPEYLRKKVRLVTDDVREDGIYKAMKKMEII